MAARLKEKYSKEIKSQLQKELGIENLMAVPKLEKIVINMGLGEATQNVKMMDPLVADLGSIAGQKPVITKAKKSIAAFKLREGMDKNEVGVAAQEEIIQSISSFALTSPFSRPCDLNQAI